MWPFSRVVFLFYLLSVERTHWWLIYTYFIPNCAALFDWTVHKFIIFCSHENRCGCVKIIMLSIIRFDFFFYSYLNFYLNFFIHITCGKIAVIGYFAFVSVPSYYSDPSPVPLCLWHWVSGLSCLLWVSYILIFDSWLPAVYWSLFVIVPEGSRLCNQISDTAEVQIFMWYTTLWYTKAQILNHVLPICGYSDIVEEHK